MKVGVDGGGREEEKQQQQTSNNSSKTRVGVVEGEILGRKTISPPSI